MLDVVESDILKNPDLRHGFFTNRGGVSEGVYSRLNAGLGSSDEKSKVIENRRRARTHLSKRELPLCTLYQCHSNRVVEVIRPWSEDQRIEADAVVTSEAGVIIGVLTADCVPILMADPEAGIIAAAHAGWKGALSGIIENAISKMEELGAQRSSIKAATGPSIQQASYEVGPELRESFVCLSTDYDAFFLPGQDDRFKFDLPGFVEARLAAAGVRDSQISALDTYRDEARFFSYRRSIHRNEPEYGRQLSAICKIGPSRREDSGDSAL